MRHTHVAHYDDDASKRSTHYPELTFMLETLQFYFDYFRDVEGNPLFPVAEAKRFYTEQYEEAKEFYLSC